MLSEAGYEAFIIKEKDLFVPSWLNISVPIKDYTYLKKNIQTEDVLVVPEAMPDFPGLKQLQCKKILFVQASSFLFERMPKGEDHISLGFRHVIIIMPHMESIIKNHINIPYTTISPFVADYFFTEDSFKKRKKQILIFPKFHQIDYSIVKYLIERHVAKHNSSWLSNLVNKENWNVKELKNLTHNQVAEEMKSSTFFISLNAFESLNVSVTEAMASGCVVFCYEGFGPKDYLRNGENAIVFNNNEAYHLVEVICEWVDSFSEKETEFRKIQQRGFDTANKYKRNICKEQLLQFFYHYSQN